MKILLIAIVLLVAVEAETYGPNVQWSPYGSNIQHGRGNNPPRGPSWMHPQQQNQNNALSPDIEWVCQNPKTNDMMFIAVDNAQQHPGSGGNRPVPHRPWHLPPESHRHQQNGHHWHQPIEGRPDGYTTPPMPTPPPINNDNNNNNYQPETTPHSHGGEGLIDIRMAA